MTIYRTSNLTPPPGLDGLRPLDRADRSPGPGFADTLKGAVGEVAQLQRASQSAVEDLAVGRTDDLAGVMTAVEKGDLALRTLLAVRGKLMDAYDEIRNMQV